MAITGTRLAENNSPGAPLDQQWELISEFVHEFRTQLTSIIGFLEMTLDEDAGPLSEQQSRFLATAKSSAGELNRLVDVLSDIARVASGRQSLNWQPLSIADQMKGALNSLQPMLEAKHHTCEWHGLEPPLLVSADARRLSVVLTSLFAYANRNLPSEATIEISLRQDASQVQVSIGGTIGPAGDEAKEEELWAGGPVDLSLTVARAIVAMHAGSCEIRQAGGRLQLCLALPTARAASAETDTS